MSAKFAHLQRTRKHDNTPPSNEEKVFAALERYFKGAEWLSEDAVGAAQAGSSPGASDTQASPPSASTLPDAERREYDGRARSRKGGTGGYDFAVIGGSKYDLKKFKGWLRTLGSDTRFVTGSGKRGPEQELLELRPDTDEWELRPDLFGDRARDAQAEALVAHALRGATLVLVGTGARVTIAKNVLKRLGTAAPVPLELP